MENKLISEELRLQMIAGYGYCAEFRATGMSTGLALLTIGSALCQPEQAIPIEDHHPGKRSDHHLAHVVENLIHILQLKHLKVNKIRTQLVLTYELHNKQPN